MSSPTRRRPTTFRALPALLLLALVAACGGSDESKDGDGDGTTTTTTTKAATTGSGIVDTIVEDLLDDEPAMDEADARCVAERLVDELGEDDAAAVNDASDDIASLPADQQEVVRATFNDCVSGTVIGAAFVDEFYANLGSDASTDEPAACMGERFEGRVGDLMVEAAKTQGGAPPAAMEALDECVPTSHMADMLTAQFEESGLSPDQARCVGDRVAERILIGQFAEIGQSGGALPPEIESILRAEVTACGGSAG